MAISSESLDPGSIGCILYRMLGLLATKTCSVPHTLVMERFASVTAIFPNMARLESSTEDSLARRVKELVRWTPCHVSKGIPSTAVD